MKQAATIIGQLTGTDSGLGSEGKRARDYFLSDRYEPDFLPWPVSEDQPIRPENLNAANDD
ncbi:hypothetical protein [Aquamicrobium zhengzhouense]|uniref:hypothetical protein n=1 Tax=Aquamicrobium zhengzhouense TaxID=2781738 RepID=UPI001AED80DA|nr:hypothetical protein [Aquamicrobium zhengzhouense]